MKKLFLLFSITLCFLSVNAQQITFTSASPVYSDAPVTVTTQGETNDLAVDLQATPVVVQPITIISPTPVNAYAGDINVSYIQYNTYYNPSSKTASSFTVKIHNSSTQDIQFKVTFTCSFIDVNTSKGSTGPVTYTVTVKGSGSTPPPTSFGNAATFFTYTKNTCGSGFLASSVTYTVPANKYHASTQAAADLLAQNDLNANGQNYANANGTCTAGFYNQTVSATYTKSNCATGYNPPSITYTVPAGKYIGATQAAANQLASNDLAANGQSYANSQGGCTAIYALLVMGAGNGGGVVHSGNETITSSDITIKFYGDPNLTQPLTLYSPTTVAVTQRYSITHTTQTGSSTLTYSVPAGSSSYYAGPVITEDYTTGHTTTTTVYTYALAANGNYIIY